MKWMLIPLFTFSVCLLASAQSVEEVVESHVKALGGREKLAQLKSVYMEAITVRPDGNEVTTKTWKVQDRLMRREIDFGMGTMTSIITDKEGWSTNPRSGGAFEAMPPEMADRQRGELDISGPLVDYAAKGHKAELAGKEVVNGSSCHLLKLTLKSGREVTYCIEEKTGLILRTKTKGGGGMRGGPGRDPNAETLTDYSDYRKTEDGFLFPHTVTIVGMGASMNMEKIEVNKPVDEKLAKPQQ